MSSSYFHPLTSIQKSKNKRTVLPKTSVIQVFLDDSETSDNCSPKGRTRILPKFTNQQVISQINRSNANPTIESTVLDSTTLIPKIFERLQSSPGTTSSPNLASVSNVKKVVNNLKDKKFKEITRLCINDHSEFEDNNAIGESNINTNINQCLSSNSNQLKNNKQNLTNYLAKDFFLDCKQRLDLNSFKSLLAILNEYKSQTKNNHEQIESQQQQKQLLNSIYNLIKTDRNICNKFSAFLTCENALTFDLLEQSIHYEKCYEFLHKLDLLMPNKCSFKKLLQSTIIANSDLLLTETSTFSTKIEEIKSRIRTITKNNPLINLELDYLFDQRFVNLEPVFEKVSLTHATDLELKKSDVALFLNQEFIDLTQANNNLTGGNSTSFGIKAKTNLDSKLIKTAGKGLATTKCAKKGV